MTERFSEASLYPAADGLLRVHPLRTGEWITGDHLIRDDCVVATPYAYISLGVLGRQKKPPGRTG